MFPSFTVNTTKMIQTLKMVASPIKKPMKKYSFLFASLLCLEFGLSSCNLFKEKEDPDPLANAAGTYVGTMQDNTAIIQNARANVTTTSRDNRLYVSSVGITSSIYQLVINGIGGETLSVSRNGVIYTGRVVVNGQSINITGSYRVSTTSPTLNFSYTGTKQ
jgi:hypothetical protein